MDQLYPFLMLLSNRSEMEAFSVSPAQIQKLHVDLTSPNATTIMEQQGVKFNTLMK